MRATTMAVAAVVVLFGCGGSTENPDAGTVADAGAPVSDAGSSADAGSTADAGSSADAGIDAGLGADAGPEIDAGIDAGSSADAGVDAGASVDAGTADAGLCGVSGTSLPATASASWYVPTPGAQLCGYSFNETHTAALPSTALPKACGLCVEVSTATASTVVRVTDGCVGCLAGTIDLSRAAFEDLAPASMGLISSVTLRAVECPGTDTPSVRLDANTNAYYLSLSVERTRSPVASVQLRPNGATTFVGTTYQSYNRFTYTSPVAFTLPLTVKINESNGSVSTVQLTSLTNTSTTFTQPPSRCP